jgi:uncharacterized membrane protein YdbT with pleckstrin-like domain
MSNATEESLLWRGSPSQWTNFGTYFLCLLLAAGVIVGWWFNRDQSLILAGLALPALWALCQWIGTKCHRYEITSERIKITTGLLSRRTQEIELYRVRDYSLVEPFWLRLVGCGDVVLSTADRSTPNTVLHAVPHATGLKDQIRAHTERMRRIRGVRDFEIDQPDPPPPS